MAKATGRDEAGKKEPQAEAQPAIRDDELERRRRELEAMLSSRRVGAKANGEGGDGKSGSSLGQGLKMSSEFIAGIIVGAALGWLIDRWLGISPWGMIVFLLLGFGAGVLNVMRSAGLIAEAGIRTKSRDGGGPETK